MITKTCSLLAVTLMLAGCSALQPESATTEIMLGDCQNGAVMTQATFGGPLRCAPQSEPVFTQAPAAPEN